jgi:hypothetical protein
MAHKPAHASESLLPNHERLVYRALPAVRREGLDVAIARDDDKE